MDNKTLQEKRAQAQALPVTVTVGKHGVTDATLEELDRHLRKDKLVKVRLLRTATEGGSTMQDQATELATRTRSTLVETRGGTAVYWRG